VGKFRVSVFLAVWLFLLTSTFSPHTLAQPLSADWILAWEEIERRAASEVPEDVASVHELIADEEIDLWLRGRALVALARHGRDGGGPAARAGLGSSNAVIRAAACEALGFAGEAESAPVLRKMLKDPDGTIRHEAAVSLSRIMGSNAWDDVKSLVDRPSVPFARQRALVLAHIDTDASLDLLRGMLASTNLVVRMETAHALHAAPRPSLVPLLLDVVSSGRGTEVRSAAESTLRSWDVELLGPPLAAVLRADQPKRVLPAIRLLFMRPSHAGGDALSELVEQGSEKMSRAVLTEAMDTLLAISPERYRDTFRRYLEDKDPTLRVRAITALAAGQPDAELFALLRDPLADPVDSVFRLALRMLEKRTTTVPEEGLVPYLSSHIMDSEPPRKRQFLDIMRRRLPSEELDAALELLTPQLRGADPVLREAASNVFKESTNEEVILKALAAQGHIARWLIVGPFDNDRYNRGFSTDFGPETSLDLAAVYDGTTRPVEVYSEEPRTFSDLATNIATRVKWQPMSLAQSDAALRLNQLVMGPNDYFVAYATAEVMAPEEQEVDIHVTADDSFKLWLNSEELLSVADEPVTKEMMKNRKAWQELMNEWRDNRHEDTARATLKKGRNRILLKVCNFTYQWYFRLRIAETNGARADFEEMELGEVQ